MAPSTPWLSPCLYLFVYIIDTKNCRNIYIYIYISISIRGLGNASSLDLDTIELNNEFARSASHELSKNEKF
jgi:hypothetical protein